MNLTDREKKIMNGLKDFQRATVDRCIELYKNGQNRVLVADEVGLGKTLIAKGVIVKLANWHQSKLDDDLFKVLYICSNADIANQNIRKLKTHDKVTVDGVSDTRLSMQHLKIFEQENDPALREGYIQLIPLTPATSLKVSNSSGIVQERALIYSILRRTKPFSEWDAELEIIMRAGADGFKNWAKDWIESRVTACDDNSDGEYTRLVCSELMESIGPSLVNDLLEQCKNVKEDKYDYLIGRNLIRSLRILFAQISIRRLNPDLVIMDEFQRFRELITATPDSEVDLLTNAFLKQSGVKTLLLSATPYKLYQTLEESANNNEDEHYKEFLEVMKFLFNSKSKFSSFKNVWSNFSVFLREAHLDTDSIINVKSAAENGMYSGVCRTERLLIDAAGSAIDDSSSKRSIEVSSKDIISFIEAERVAQSVSATLHIPVEYVKSCPYLLSFMEKYQYKKTLERLKPGFNLSSRKVLFIDGNKMKRYEQLPANNARLESLIEIAFKNNAEKLLWVPPSLPYYRPSGVFRNINHFSKTLVFSGWEMVPRMIACMLSYEAERLTIGKIYAKEVDKSRKGYFPGAKIPRFPRRRLVSGRERPLTVASQFLADAYTPTQHMGKSIKQIKNTVRAIIEKQLNRLRKQYHVSTSGANDPNWYWVAPLLFDDERVEIPERKMPADLADVLTNMAIASPAICAMRLLGDKEMAKEFAKEISNMFDSPEAIAVVELAYGRSEDAHYKNVLKYCVDGNFAAVLDEYAHMLDTIDAENLNAGLKATTASYPIDTYTSFSNGNSKQKISMRSHFAAGFYQTKSNDKTLQRKDNLRTAFNSPFRPFVLATTSIGQEGLDFHNYTRRIMHWNLPHNPIDLEQREGRINRYKCLSIRQSLADKYNKCKFHSDVWSEMFELALKEKDGKIPELVPYWCLPGGGDIKIERIVPMYPFSRDKAVYDRLIKILSLYRITLGQARQEELLEYLFHNCNEDNLKDYFINLSPFSKM